MDDYVKKLIIENTTSGKQLSNVEFTNLITALDIQLPSDYIEFLTTFNGCEGSLTDDVYIALWSLNELKSNNEMYAVKEFAPELFFIGSDGGGTAFALNREDLSYVEVPFIGMSLEESENLGTNFSEFILKKLEKAS